MRLLFVSNLFPDQREPYRGLDNATVLHELARRWEVRAIGLRPALPWQHSDWHPRASDIALRPAFRGVRYIPRIGHRWNHRLYARSLHGALDTIRRDWMWDVALCPWLYPDACAMALLRSQFHAPIVPVAQGSDAHQYLRIPARKKIITSLLSTCPSIITRSAELARLLAQAGLRKDRIHPIYNGVDTTIFFPGNEMEKKAARRFFGLPESVPIVLFVGNFLPIKNPSLLIEAQIQLRHLPGLSDTHLLMIGGGPLEADLRHQADERQVPVIFAGRHDSTGVAKAMRAADALALPSDNEGVPNVILEAFTSGLPVVASKVGGIAEVHHKPFLGQLVPPRDVAALATALAAVLESRPDVDAITEHGRTFTWEATAGHYHRLLAAAAERETR